LSSTWSGASFGWCGGSRIRTWEGEAGGFQDPFGNEATPEFTDVLDMDHWKAHPGLERPPRADCRPDQDSASQYCHPGVTVVSRLTSGLRPARVDKTFFPFVHVFDKSPAAGFLVTQEFQLARGYSPVLAGVRLLPFFATPMFISPIAGAVSDRIGRRPVMATGLFLQTAGFVWVAIRGSLSTNWVELDIALLIAGVGVSMALPTVPTAVLSAVAPRELGKASGINYMMQRFGAVFAIAVASAVFAAYGHLGTPASVTDGFKPALAACAGFALLAALSALAITPPKTQHAPRPRPRRSTGRTLVISTVASRYSSVRPPVQTFAPPTAVISGSR
jgi:MFS family permease